MLLRLMQCRRLPFIDFAPQMIWISARINPVPNLLFHVAHWICWISVGECEIAPLQFSHNAPSEGT